MTADASERIVFDGRWAATRYSASGYKRVDTTSRGVDADRFATRAEAEVRADTLKRPRR